jgi:hypothetical protein
MIADATVGIAGDAVEDADEPRDPHVEAGLLLDLPAGGVDAGLAQLHEPARHAPESERRRPAPPHQQDAPLVKDDGADADAGRIRVLAGHCGRAADDTAVRKAALP